MPRKVEEKKKIIIIGAGISGLSAGIYAQKNGYISEIYEKNPVAGGLCVSWKRDGMTIDGCIHWLTGTKEGTQLRDMWRDVGAFTDEDIIHHDNFGVIEYEGQKFTLWADVNRLEAEMLKFSPEDAKEIKKLGNLIISIQNMPLPIHTPMDIMSPKSTLQVGLGLFPYLNTYLKSSKLTLEQYSKRFKSPLIRYVLTHIVPGDNNLYGTIFAYGTVCVMNGGVPKGGSSQLIKNMVNEYESSGGFINYVKEVQEIIVKDKKAIGIRLKDGKVVYGDYIVPACDSYETIRKLLGNKYHDSAFEKRYQNIVDYPTPSCVYISYRANIEKIKESGFSGTLLFPTSPFRVGNSIADEVKIREYSYDPTFIDGDDALVTVLIHQSNRDFPYWEKLYKNRAAYKEEKSRLASIVQEEIEKKLPELKGYLKPIDVTSPMTYRRYCNAYMGSYMSFALGPRGSRLMHKGTFRGLKNCYIATQWVQSPGGIPLALMSGKFAIQRILKKEHKFYKITSKKFLIFHK